MTALSVRVLFAVCFAVVLAQLAQAQDQILAQAQTQDQILAQAQTRRTSALVEPRAPAPDTRPKSLVATVTLADVGYADGLRLANLGGRREVFIPLPQGVDMTISELVLTLDDVSAHDARRSLEVIVNDRSVAALALDGHSMARVVHIPLVDAVARDGFLKIAFLYSGAATQDRCIDVRYVGDSVTVRPESAIELEIGATGTPAIAGTAALMPEDVAILLSDSPVLESDIATALTIARSLTLTGRHVTFYNGFDALPDIVKRDDQRRWSRGIIVVGALSNALGHVDAPVGATGGTTAKDGTLAAVRIGGLPALLVSDVASARAGGLLGNASLAALRDTRTASVGDFVRPKLPTDRISFDELGFAPAKAEVFGRADLSVVIPTRTLPPGTHPSRIALNVMVAPDGAGEKAVVSAFVNERLLASAVAATDEPTRLDFALPDGLVGSVLNIRAAIQRPSAQGDCRFEPQGYPAEILGSSSITLTKASAAAEDFSDLGALWANGVEVLIPSNSAQRPVAMLGLLADVLGAASPETAPITVKYVAPGSALTPSAPFIAVSDTPVGATQRVRFDRGRVVVTDRSGGTLLDIGGLATGAVAQLVTVGDQSGIWIKPLTGDGSLPVPRETRLDRGNVAFIDKSGVALAMSTERDTLLRISYPDEVSWFTVGERFRSWIVGSVWLLVTVSFLFVLQRAFRRRSGTASE